MPRPSVPSPCRLQIRNGHGKQIRTASPRRARRRPCGAPGRPRSARVDEAILDAARAELAERGYARMSVDAVAARAGVSKPTVYLRHPTKADLATAAIASMRAASRPAPTGDVRADLIAHLRLLRAGLERPFGMATLGTVLAEEHETPSCWRLPRAPRGAAPARAVRGPGRRRASAASCGRRQSRLAVSALVGGFFARYLAGEPLGGRFVTSLVDTVLDGLRPR